MISHPVLDAALSDICISTSAAPTYFRGHYFTNKDENGQEKEFNLIDGGIAANNPVSFFKSGKQMKDRCKKAY